MAFQFQSVASVSPFVIDAYGIDYALLGTLIGLYMLPGVVVALPGGLIAGRFGDKRVAVAGLALMVAGGLIMAAAGGFWTAAAGRIAAGIGAVLLNIVLTKMTTDWFAGREIVLSMAILLGSWPLGIGLALVTLGPIAEATSLGAAILVTAAACAVALVLVLWGYRPPSAVDGATLSPAPSKTDARETAGGKIAAAISRREVLLVSLAGLIWTTYNVGYIIVMSFAPALLVAGTASVADAGAIVSLINWVMVLALPMAGYFAQRINRPGAVMMLSFAATAAAIAAIPQLGAPAALFVAMGLLFAPPAGVIMALPAELLRPQARAVGMGVFFTWYYAGMAVLPAAAGLARDATGAADAPILFAAIVMAASIVWLAALRALQRRPETAAQARSGGRGR